MINYIKSMLIMLIAPDDKDMLSTYVVHNNNQYCNATKQQFYLTILKYINFVVLTSSVTK